ncbi:very-long-chain (3R)-3-hydroxyacyl-CoA dehydratase 4 isoform X3 [Tursiops truncatus]|uniref:very-long-chain (3R)-3-hydroxyacyl-CoA dehydratase 4 isoform X3 n=1 Tax=Tursiops truncatus TaxID=9739 RepID=UPI003CCF0D85
MGPVELPAWLQPRYRKNAYLFIYYLIQFCGHSWIFTNMTVRFFSFGKDSMVDTFYAIGLVMRLCQSISLLELLHIYVGIESDHLLPRFLQLTERIIILFVVITSQEEVQEKYVVHFSLGWRYCGHETTLSVAKEEDESKFPTQSCKEYYNCICQFSLKAFKIQEMGMMGHKGFPAMFDLLKPDAFRT